MGIDHSNERISFRPGLRVVQRAEHIVLFSAGDARAARIPRAASPLLRLLEQGAQRSEMQRALQTAYPGDPTIAIKLDRFLFRLEEAGLLDSGELGLRTEGAGAAGIFWISTQSPAAVHRFSALCLACRPTCFSQR